MSSSSEKAYDALMIKIDNASLELELLRLSVKLNDGCVSDINYTCSIANQLEKNLKAINSLIVRLM